uniref:Glycosyl transferase CAP10 domain-containing protein n=1 Tax=Arundo donax TaxID=35708 RepID=A0A0A9C1U2_ARUDO
MFGCQDLPVVDAGDHRGKRKQSPSPLFRYCGSEATLDIAFPDWSFWGRS